MIINSIKFLILVLPILLRVALITLRERKVLRLTGNRLGPTKVSYQGILQPIADAIKLGNKRPNCISNFSFMIYYLSSSLIIFLALMAWTCCPWGASTSLNWKFSILILILILGVRSMKSIIAGWSTFRKYPLIGSMRTVSQIISYEAVLYMSLLQVVWITIAFKFEDVESNITTFLVTIIPAIFLLWLVSVLAELNRTPYDFSEGERELVRGFNTEFGSKSFTLIFLSEYRNIIFFIVLTTKIFFSQIRRILLIATVALIIFWIIWMRRTLPRLRLDKFMIIAWKFYIPFITILVIIRIIKTI